MKSFDSFCVEIGTSVHEALKVIEQGSTQIALVVDRQKRLVGTLTDGDVRRGLLEGFSLDTAVDEFMNHNFQFAKSKDDHVAVLEMMRKKRIRQFPVLDENGRLLNLLLLDDLFVVPKLPNAVVIMAGGKGKRLRPHTNDCPKPMLHVGKKPMLEILLDKCIDAGFCQFFFSVNYLKEQIIQYFGDGSKWGVSINYLIENEPLGTAGSLHLLPRSLTEPFLVLNGDVLSQLNTPQLFHFHRDNNSDATMCVREYQVNVPYGVVETNGVELTGFQEKPTYKHFVNAGIYVIEPRLLDLLPPYEFNDMPTFLELAQQHSYRVSVCPIHEYWIDIGRPESLKQAQSTWEQ